MKAAPVMSALKRRQHVVQTLVHTGQHYDANMSDVFFEQLGMAAPDVNLAVGSGTHARQTAEIMTRFEPVLRERKPDLVLVYGDVNSTVATALVSAKLGVRVGHVEAGLRSFDRTMPEEINRLITDQLADLLFTPSEDGDMNLRREGIPAEKIFRVGNVMIDSLVKLLPAAQRQTQNGLPERFALVTLHRPANVDDGVVLKSILQSLLEVSRDLCVIFPRTRAPGNASPSLDCMPASSSFSTRCLTSSFWACNRAHPSSSRTPAASRRRRLILAFCIPCLTLRENTERPVTISLGTNVLVGHDPDKLRLELSRVLAGEAKKGTVPPLWDGQAGERIAAVLAR